MVSYRSYHTHSRFVTIPKSLPLEVKNLYPTGPSPYPANPVTTVSTAS